MASKKSSTSVTKTPKTVAEKSKKASPAPVIEQGKQKGGMHSRFREITVIMTNGESFQTRSTYPHDSLKLEIDILTHPAWTRESNFVNTKANKVSDFNARFKGLSFLKTKDEA